ncbi:T9SS type A sorting domain-containing protein [Flavobacterium sp.]|uniref:T9SS type A sorting domain-containing protein n=1 Tax=Flavobacterium sp. TaxID=239 RepID=UPI003A936E7D
MKKKLLLGAFLFGSFLTVKAQSDCASAAAVTVGVTNVSEVTGTYPSGTDAQICSFADGDPDAGFAAWYSYTPASNGVITVDAGIESNAVTVDTRLRILSGTCASLSCEATADDISYPSDLRSRIVDLPVVAGTTYYIVFDNMWYDGDTVPSFDFELSYTEITCFAPTEFAFSTETPPTETTVNILITDPALSTPLSYDFEYGLTGYTQGSGAIETISVTDGEAALSNLTSGTTYDFYIRSVCGEGDESEWVGPVSFTTLFGPADLPYEYGFEGNGGWGSTGGWTITTNAAVGQDASYQGEGFAFSNTSPTAASDSWLYTRDINVVAGETVYFSFYATYLGGAGTSASLDLTFGTGTDDQEVISSFTINANVGQQTIAYVPYTTSWTPTESGTFTLAFHNNSPAIGTAALSMLLDNFVVTNELSTDNFLATQLSIYPNPSSDVINITNASNILLNGVEIIDLNGRVVKSAKFNGVSEAQVNISDLSAGMYLMNVSSDQGTTTKKIVKK